MGLIAPTTINLYLDHNFITELPALMMATSPTPVQRIHFGSNNITRVDVNAFRWFPQLNLLYLTSNFLTELPVGVFAWIPHLASLGLSDNMFAAAPILPPLPKMVSYVFDGNPLSTPLSKANLAGIASSVQVLSLQSINLGTLGVPSNLFEDMTAVGSIDLSSNGLTSLPNDLFLPVAHLLSTLTMEVDTCFWARWFCC